MDPGIPVPPQFYGGIERVIYDVAQQYVALGHSVTLVAGPNSKSPGRLIVYGKNGPQKPDIDLQLLNNLYNVHKIIRKEIKNHDVIHNFGRLIFLLPFLKSDIVKVQTYMRYVNRKNIKWFDLFKPKSLTYTAVSDFIANTGRTPKSSWLTVYNCAPINQYRFNDKVADDAPLVFLGRLERCKGAHSAIEVAKRSNHKLIIAGNISDIEHEKRYFYNEIKPLIDGEQIVYVGRVDDAQKNTLLSNAKALLSPVEWMEPFPVIIPEAYACGTPVLAFDDGGMREGIIQGVTGFISTNVDEMTEQIKDIHRLNRHECRKKAERDYSDLKIANDYLSVYKNGND